MQKKKEKKVIVIILEKIIIIVISMENQTRIIMERNKKNLNNKFSDKSKQEKTDERKL